MTPATTTSIPIRIILDPDDPQPIMVTVGDNQYRIDTADLPLAGGLGVDLPAEPLPPPPIPVSVKPDHYGDGTPREAIVTFSNGGSWRIALDTLTEIEEDRHRGHFDHYGAYSDRGEATNLVAIYRPAPGRDQCRDCGHPNDRHRHPVARTSGCLWAGCGCTNPPSTPILKETP